MSKRAQTFGIGWVLGLWLLVSVAPVHGQSDSLMVIQIPFSFSVGNKTLPAGEYTVERLAHSNGRLLIRRTDGRAARIFLAIESDTARSAEDNLLVFRRYGEEYFLSRVLCGATHSRYELLPSRVERATASKASERQPQMLALAARP